MNKAARKKQTQAATEETLRLARVQTRKEFEVSEKKGKMRKFRCRYVVDVEVAVSERTLKEAMSKDWRDSYYLLSSEQEVADHLVYNYARNGLRVPDLDGFAHLEKSDVEIIREAWTSESD